MNGQNNPAPANSSAETVFTADHASSVIEDVDAILKEIKGLTGHGAVIGAMLLCPRSRANCCGCREGCCCHDR